jgi:hypothetical protein
MIENYVAMITSMEDEWADVNLIAKFLDRPTAWTIWNFIRNQDPLRGLFYHSRQTADKVSHISLFQAFWFNHTITRNLGQ